MIIMKKIYKSDAEEAAFLLGGIGTGNISINSRGELVDWELFNAPNKGNKSSYSFFSIFAKEEGKSPVAKVLETHNKGAHRQPRGYHPGRVVGLPHIEESEFCCEYPIVNVDFFDSELPVNVKLECFTPFIPLNVKDSSLPCAVFRYKIKNTSKNPVDVSICETQMNLIGFSGVGCDGFSNMNHYEGTQNTFFSHNGLSGIEFTNPSIADTDINCGSMAIMTKDKNITHKAKWLAGGWWDGITDFWNEFSNTGILSEKSKQPSHSLVEDQLEYDRQLPGSLSINHNLLPDEEKVFEFILSWHFPIRNKIWDKDMIIEKANTTKNFYATLWSSAKEAGIYCYENLENLENLSKKFRDSLFASTLPDEVIDALSSNITVIRSTTCFMLEDGNFYAWEGSHEKEGSCHGTCTHVWNYAQTLAFLFPSLEMSARKIEFLVETDDTGHMAFRNQQTFGYKRSDFHAAADGQMGTVVRAYREWKLSGDDEFIKEIWDKIKKALDYAFKTWDKDRDFVFESCQHNTYDIEFYGQNSFTSSMFYAALKAAANIAEYLGEKEIAEKYKNALSCGSTRMDQMLWNGEYYIQKIDDIDNLRYQYGVGCLSDQLLGQSLAHVVGLGYILPKEHVKKAVKSIFDRNFKTNFKNHTNLQRVYALNDEKGLVLCTWNEGEKPRFPFVYSDEVWTGIEYQVAANLIYEGFIDEALEIVKAARDRHDGYARNPYNEEECGNHYARSLASWSLLTALSGFRFDMTRSAVGFDPKINADDFKTFWSTGKAWGIYTQKKDDITGVMDKKIEILYGEGVVLQDFSDL